jgi:hypothetical protein
MFRVRFGRVFVGTFVFVSFWKTRRQKVFSVFVGAIELLEW